LKVWKTRRFHRNLHYLEFIKEYEVKNKPVVITGAMKNWKAMQKWSAEKFSKHYGQKLLKTNGTSGGHCYKLTYDDYYVSSLH
jgi:hypothetical protein